MFDLKMNNINVVVEPGMEATGTIIWYSLLAYNKPQPSQIRQASMTTSFECTAVVSLSLQQF